MHYKNRIIRILCSNLPIRWYQMKIGIAIVVFCWFWFNVSVSITDSRYSMPSSNINIFKYSNNYCINKIVNSWCPQKQHMDNDVDAVWIADWMYITQLPSMNITGVQHDYYYCFSQIVHKFHTIRSYIYTIYSHFCSLLSFVACNPLHSLTLTNTHTQTYSRFCLQTRTHSYTYTHAYVDHYRYIAHKRLWY